MSFCIRNLKTQPFPEDTKISSLSHIKAVPQNSRNRYVTDRITRLGFPCKKTSLCIRKKASYTLEAAIIIPLVAAFLYLFFSFSESCRFRRRYRRHWNMPAEKAPARQVL